MRKDARLAELRGAAAELVERNWKRGTPDRAIFYMLTVDPHFNHRVALLEMIFEMTHEPEDHAAYVAARARAHRELIELLYGWSDVRLKNALFEVRRMMEDARYRAANPGSD